MSLLERMKNFLKGNKTDELNYQRPELGYEEAKTLLDNLGGLQYCKIQKEQGVTQKELANKLNIKQPTLSKYCIKEGCQWTHLTKAPKRTPKPINPTKKNRIKVLEELGGYDYVLEQKNLGKTYSQISVELGQAPDDNWISNYMRYRGYKTKKIKITGETDKINKAGGLLFLKSELKNKPAAQVADELGIRKKTIYSYLYKRGYTMKKFKTAEDIEVPEDAINWKLYETWDKEYTIDQFKKAIELKGITKTAEALNCTEYTLRLYCRLREIPL